MESAEERIQERLRNILSGRNRNQEGCLKVVFERWSYTTEDVFTYLAKEGFDVSYRGVSAMVGS